MNISQNGINLIKKFEGCVLQVYLDVVGVKTVGYGHTGADVNALPVGARISQEQADLLLKTDIAKFERNVNRYDSTYHWTQNEYDALVSFAYNIGSIDSLVNNGLRTKGIIADKILEYNKAGKKVISGLVERRKIERALFLSDTVNVKVDFQIGKIYTTNTGLYIRNNPAGDKVKVDSITASAKAQSHFDNLGYAILNKDTRVTCKGVQELGDSTWIKIPSGWICAIEKGKRYIDERL